MSLRKKIIKAHWNAYEKLKLNYYYLQHRVLKPTNILNAVVTNYDQGTDIHFYYIYVCKFKIYFTKLTYITFNIKKILTEIFIILIAT